MTFRKLARLLQKPEAYFCASPSRLFLFSSFLVLTLFAYDGPLHNHTKRSVCATARSTDFFACTYIGNYNALISCL